MAHYPRETVCVMALENPASLPKNVIKALEKGRMIEAIKLLRSQANMGLKESKEAIEAYTKSHSQTQPPRSAPMSTGDQRSPTGLVIMIALALLGYAMYMVLAE
jgi:hypothetical protein